MDPLQKEALRKNRVHLTNDLLVDEILPHLVACGLFTEHMEESVMSHPTRLQKVQQLLSDLPRRGPEAFPLFVKCLRKSGQNHLANAIQDTLTQLQHSAPQTDYPHTDPTYRDCINMPPQSVTFQPPQNAPFQPPPNAPFQPHPNIAFQHGETNVLLMTRYGHGIATKPENDSNTFPAVGGLGQCLKQEPGQSQACYKNSEKKLVVDEKGVSQNHYHAGSSFYPGFNLKDSPQTMQMFTGQLQQRVLPMNDPEDELIYKMTSKPRGYALIINNRYFQGTRRLLHTEERLGTDLDRDNLQNVFKALNYDVTVFDNMKGREMEIAVKGFSMRDGHRDVDSTIVVLLSNGEQNVIYGTDYEPVEIDKLIQCFDGAHCPALRGKPKWFVIQACRGRKFNSGFKAMDGESPPPGRNAGPVPATPTSKNVVGPAMLEQLQEMHVRNTENLRQKLPEEAAMLVAYSTVPGKFNSGFKAMDGESPPPGRNAGPVPATPTSKNVVGPAMLEQLQEMHVRNTENLRQKLPEEAAMLVAYSTVPGKFNSGFKAMDGESPPPGRNAGPVPATPTSKNVVGPAMLEQLQEMHVRNTENLRQKLPEEADMLVAYSTVPGKFNSGFEATDGETHPSGRVAGPVSATWTRQNVVCPMMLEQLQEMHVRDTENLTQKLPEGVDMLVAYATMPGFVSWRNSERGSWFIQELCTVLYEYAHKEDLLSMMTVVNNRVATAYESACNKKQMPSPVSTLRKKWFFYPNM